MVPSSGCALFSTLYLLLSSAPTITLQSITLHSCTVAFTLQDRGQCKMSGWLHSPSVHALSSALVVCCSAVQSCKAALQFKVAKMQSCCSSKLPDSGSSSPPAVMSQLSEHPCSHPRPPSPLLPPLLIKSKVWYRSGNLWLIWAQWADSPLMCH